MIVRYSETARRQLIDIWQLSKRRWGEVRADRYVSALYDAVQLTAAGKKRAQPRPEIRADVSMIRSGSHHIYLALEPGGDVLHVVVVLHQRMEPRRHIRKALKGE